MITVAAAGFAWWADGFYSACIFRAFWGVGWAGTYMPGLKAFSDIITINRAQIDDWLLLGFTAGVEKDQWLVEFYAENLTNEKASIANSFIYDRNRVTYTRPLTMGLRLSYDF